MKAIKTITIILILIGSAQAQTVKIYGYSAPDSITVHQGDIIVADTSYPYHATVYRNVIVPQTDWIHSFNLSDFLIENYFYIHYSLFFIFALSGFLFLFLWLGKRKSNAYNFNACQAWRKRYVDKTEDCEHYYQLYNETMHRFNLAVQRETDLNAKIKDLESDLQGCNDDNKRLKSNSNILTDAATSWEQVSLINQGLISDYEKIVGGLRIELSELRKEYDEAGKQAAKTHQSLTNQINRLKSVTKFRGMAMDKAILFQGKVGNHTPIESDAQRIYEFLTAK
jgi:hypothetical protein